MCCWVTRGKTNIKPHFAVFRLHSNREPSGVFLSSWRIPQQTVFHPIYPFDLNPLNSVRQFSFFFVCATVFACFSSAGAVETQEKVLLRPAQSSEIPLPSAQRVGSVFYAMDVAKFEALANWKE